MKKVIIFLTLAVMLGCSKDADPCTCDLDIIIVDGNIGVTGSYTILKAPSDCELGFDWQTYRDEENLPPNHWLQSTDCY